MLYHNLIHLGLITLSKTELVKLQPIHARLGDKNRYTHKDQNG